MNTVTVGKIYSVNHCRKGNFDLLVTKDNVEWVTGNIISGNAKAMLDYNEKAAGEEITVRKSLCDFQEIKG